ncbi:MAG: T9SS type A sorting domain-containing protein [Pedobacter sp.]|nr:T9SS type A sorting domain-containing protein [Pedobacter sp.]
MGSISKIAFFLSFLCIFCIGGLFGSAVFAQKIDSSKISLKPKPKIVSRVPVIKGSVQTYKPGNINFNGTSSSPTSASASKSIKILTVLKLYPNPVSEQLNINLRLEREANLSVKITDPLGNEIITLMNERAPAGEQTKTFTIPNKLNTGIYFVRIVAGGDPKVLKISVL